MAKQKNVTLHENSDDEEPQVPVTQPEEEEDSTEEEDETTSSDEEDDDGEDDRHELVIRKPQPQISSKPSSSSSEDETDSEPEPQPEPQKAKPSSKAKSQSSTPASQAKSGVKRGAENSIEHSNQSKRGKKAVEDHAAGSDDEDLKKSRDESKSAFQRVFSEKDEIGILKGMAEFTSKTGKDPHKCSDEFYEFMKGSKLISSNASSNQLKDKIRRLKKKFENNLKKGRSGKGAFLSKPHELEAFNLSKNIWGGSGGGGGGGEAGSNETSKNVKVNNEKAVKSTPKKENGSKKAIVPQSNGKPEVKSKLNSEVLDSNECKEVDELPETSLALTSLMRYDGSFGKTYGKDYIRNGLEKLGASKREELEGRWRKLQEAENELYAQTAEFYAEQIKLIFQANKSSS
ncbi:hypothetical protein PIB30_022096 [Stylosanthes scabra]|uniref:Glabrous enhancer-binding protein-like DBD domain-containing protein n=1 Tax=Stylosanthes scabra TaxID=79078 RepID=A0ABU6S9S2_9FABA|nr:hypothetical protein [Stylosanthes scabra]